jgi:hypothetical protein
MPRSLRRNFHRMRGTTLSQGSVLSSDKSDIANADLVELTNETRCVDGSLVLSRYLAVSRSFGTTPDAPEAVNTNANRHDLTSPKQDCERRASFLRLTSDIRLLRVAKLLDQPLRLWDQVLVIGVGEPSADLDRQDLPTRPLVKFKWHSSPLAVMRRMPEFLANPCGPPEFAAGMYTAFPYKRFRFMLISAAVASVKLTSNALAEAVSVFKIRDTCHDDVAFATELRTGMGESLSTEAELFTGTDGLIPRPFNSQGGFP